MENQDQPKRGENLVRWKLGLPVFEMYFAVLIFGALFIALLLPLIHWVRELFR